MKYQKPFLTELCNQGKPLADIGITPAAGENIHELIRLINDLGPDIEVREGRYNFFIRSGKLPGHVLLIEGDATKEALERLFGWILVRDHKPRWDAVKQRYDGVHADVYWWKEVQLPQFYPESLQGRIESMGISQPGTNDDGQDDLIAYALPLE